MAFRALGAAAALSLAPRALAYSEMNGYMPVSDVTEHAAIIADVTLMFDALSTTSLTDNSEAGGVYTTAKCIYEDGGGNSCKTESTPRTLQGFATKDLDTETYAEKFYASGNAVDWWDAEISAALDGTGTYADLSDLKRVTVIKKATMGLLTWYAAHELEAAIDKAAVADTRSDAGSGHAWDEGWAFYRGPAEDGDDTPWEVAGKRDSNFPDGTVVATAIVPYFNAGLIAVRSATYDATAAEYARDVIYKMWAITYLRAALKYLEISETTYDEKAHAEGYAYWMAIDGWWHSYDSASATSMREAVDITKTSIAAGTFCTTKALIEAAYPSVGIDCDMVGTFEDTTITCSGTTTESISADTTTDSTATGACSAPTVTFNDGASMVDAVDDVAGSDITCSSYACASLIPASTDASAARALSADAALAGVAALASAALQAS